MRRREVDGREEAEGGGPGREAREEQGREEGRDVVRREGEVVEGRMESVYVEGEKGES